MCKVRFYVLSRNNRRIFPPNKREERSCAAQWLLIAVNDIFCSVWVSAVNVPNVFVVKITRGSVVFQMIIITLKATWKVVIVLLQ